MTTFLVSGPDEAEKFAQFKKVAKALGYTVKSTQEKVAKKPRTQEEEDLVDGYKEMLAHKRGEIMLSTVNEFLKELEEIPVKKNGN